MKKLKNKAGETLGEVLVALLIVSLSFLILTGAVISAAKVNSRLANDTIAFKVDEARDTASSAEIQIGGKTVGVTLHQTEKNGYCYYD